MKFYKERDRPESKVRKSGNGARIVFPCTFLPEQKLSFLKLHGGKICENEISEFRRILGF